ncbi:MAG: hypothetical protein ACM3ZV_08820 [Bacillota bacterium]
MRKRADQRHLFSDWRDFGREYVLGVLTALFAQQAAQSLDWRQKVDAALADMDQELSNGDGPEAYVRLAIYQCLDSRLRQVRQAAEAGNRAAVRGAIGGIDLPLRTYNSFAREAANSADIAAHMPARRMFEYRVVYSLMPELDELHRKELVDLAQLRSLPATGGPLSQEEKRTVLDATENLILDNDRVRRASSFTLRHMRDLGIGIARAQLRNNLADVPVYDGCLTREIKPMIDLSAPTYPTQARR